MNLPRPASHVWSEWLDTLSQEQLSAVHAWRRFGYNEFLSPKTCWYILCGQFIPAEKAMREKLSEQFDIEQVKHFARRAERREQAILAAQQGRTASDAHDQPLGATKDAKRRSTGLSGINTKLSEGDGGK